MKSYGTALSKLLDIHRPDSFTSKMRQKRWEFFRELAASVERPMKILDVGGTQIVWERIGFANNPDIHITVLNYEQMYSNYENIVCVKGDACNMQQYKDKEFDIVFSNSVIEHVGDDERIRQMAEEVKRVGKNYYLQTPNYFFPVEPHFSFPLFQFLPIGLRATLLQHFDLGWVPKRPARADAEAEVKAIHLLSKRDVKRLFPKASIRDERLFGLTKSIQAYEFHTQKG
jgi:2-polyprenyl-3-methyl-5-hydroxy-6-metoxy-1,4-benzoquinol methylase